MSFIKKLFFWTKSDNIRDSDIKGCTTPTLHYSFRFPRRDFYISSKNKPKEYHDISCSTSDLSVDRSVQCEIYNAPIWHKKSKNKTKSIVSKSETKQSIESDTNANLIHTPSIEIKINFPENPKKLRMDQEIDLTGIESFFKKSEIRKPSTSFVFDDQHTEFSKKEAEINEAPKLIHSASNHIPQIHLKSTNNHNKIKDSGDTFNPIAIKSKTDEDEYSNLFSDLDLPKPKGRFIFDDDDNEI